MTVGSASGNEGVIEASILDFVFVRWYFVVGATVVIPESLNQEGCVVN